MKLNVDCETFVESLGKVVKAAQAMAVAENKKLRIEARCRRMNVRAADRLPQDRGGMSDEQPEQRAV